jgi:Ca2+-transporting ATPase
MNDPGTIPPHAQGADQVLAALGSAPAGLDPAEAAARLQTHGPNRLPAPAGEGPWLLLGRQFNNPISWVLVGAGALALALGKHTDAAVVLAAVVVNALVGFVQEWRAGKAIAALSALVPESCTVLRGGATVALPAEQLVPGDVVLLAGGDKVPADLRLLGARNLRIEEAALTGESVPAAKDEAAVAADAALGDRACLAFSGTLVTQGAGQGVVVATGEATELGRINRLLAGAGSLETPLTRDLAQVGKLITWAVVGISALLLLWGWLAKDAPFGEALMTAVTLAVAAIPEGLPAIVTIALAIGVRRMADRRAVVRHLPAVETLGSTTVICTDKTGTLTRNEMTVQALWCPAGREYRVGGVGWAPHGVVTRDGAPVERAPAELRELLLAGVLCNDAGLEEQDGRWSAGGDPTEAALLVAARKVGLDDADLRRRHARLDLIPFDSATKYMVTLNDLSGGPAALMKGACEMVLERCSLDQAGRERALAAMEGMARHGMRVLALARREAEPGRRGLDPRFAGGGFTLLGLAGMIDPPRQEAIDAIATCHRAGIAVKMITGDHHATAAAIGRELGLVRAGGEALSGADLDRLDEAGFADAAHRCMVFARVSPEHKLRLVGALQARGEVVAMTGDGVNDAPALKRADIGVAMGITGTAVSKDAAKVVLADDNFATIAAAVEEGRRVYDNLIKAIAFVLPTNLGLAAILAAAIFLFPTVDVLVGGQVVHELLLPMSPTQVLWINLVASVTLSIPLAFEVLEPGAMARPPRRRGQPVLSRFVLVRTALVSLAIAAAACLLFLWEFRRVAGAGGAPLTPAAFAHALAEAQSVAVTAVVLIQCFYLLHCRSLHLGLGAMGWGANPWVWAGIGLLLLLQLGFVYLPPLQAAFASAPLDAAAWLRTVAAAALILPLISLEKWLWRRFAG